MHITYLDGGREMPRVMKCRKVCCEPKNIRFTPDSGNDETILLSVEELESIRLCDLESMEQDSAAAMMNISRGTFQRILYSAHKKVAEALCCGKGIFISGGNYEIADMACQGARRCSRCRFRNENTNQTKGDAEV